MPGLSFRLGGWPPLAHPFWALIPTVLCMGTLLYLASGRRMRWEEGELGTSAFAVFLLACGASVLLWIAHWRSRSITLDSAHLRLRWGVFKKRDFAYRLTPETRARRRLDGVLLVEGLDDEGQLPPFGFAAGLLWSDPLELIGLDPAHVEELIAVLEARAVSARDD